LKGKPGPWFDAAYECEQKRNLSVPKTPFRYGAEKKKTLDERDLLHQGGVPIRSVQRATLPVRQKGAVAKIGKAKKERIASSQERGRPL